MAEALNYSLCETFTKSFLLSAQDTAEKISEKTITEHLVGFTAFVVAFGAASIVDLATTGSFRSRYARMCGTASREGVNYLVDAFKKAKWEDEKIQIKQLIQKGDPTAQNLCCDLFQCFFTKLAIDIYFAFEDLMKSAAAAEEHQETIFEEFGKFAGKVSYKSCKGASCQEDIIKNFITLSLIKKVQNKAEAILGITSKMEKAALKIFTQAVPAWWPNSQKDSQQDCVIVLVEKSALKTNENIKCRPPFYFEQEIISKVWEEPRRDTQKNHYFIKQVDFQNFCYVEQRHVETLEKLLLKIQIDETLNPQKALKHFIDKTIENYSNKILCEIEKTQNMISTIVPAIKEELQASTTTHKFYKSPFFSLAKNPCSSFFGREETLTQIHEAFQGKGKSISSSSFVIITGLAGIGKTETARKYASIHYPTVYPAIIWINAQTLESVRSSFIEAVFATAVSYDVKDHQTEAKVELIANIVYRKLSKDYKGQNILLIFDNALQMKSLKLVDTSGTESEIGINRFLPNQTYGVRFHVLVTSQNQDWSGSHTFIKLNQLNSADELSLLKNIFGRHLVYPGLRSSLKNEVHNLKDILMGHPLGICVAAANILDGLGQKKISQDELTDKIQDYIEQFNTSNEGLSLGSGSDESPYDKLMANVLDLAILRLEKKEHGNRALQLLHMMSYLCPDDMEEQVCYNIFYSEEFKDENFKSQKQRKELSQCLDSLENMSLLTLGEKKTGDSENRLIELHRLVQKIIREKYKENTANLDLWFKPLPFVLNYPTEHALHVLVNICSTFQKRIPIFALASTHSEFSRKEEFSIFYECDNLFMETNVRHKVKAILLQAQQQEEGDEGQYTLVRKCPMEGSVAKVRRQERLDFLYRIVCISDASVNNTNAEHIPEIIQAMKKYMEDLFLQYIGIKAVSECGHHLTQDQEKCVTDWIEIFIRTTYPEYTNYMSNVHDKALLCCFHYHFQLPGDTVVRHLASVEMFIKLNNNSKQPIDNQPQCWEYFRSTFEDLFKSILNHHPPLQESDKARIDNVVLETVNIITRRLSLVSLDTKYHSYSKTICAMVIAVSNEPEHAKMFWSSKPFMESLLRCCVRIVRHERLDDNPISSMRAAATLIALFAEASDEDFNLNLSMHEDMEKVLPFILGGIKRLCQRDPSKNLPSEKFSSIHLPSHLLEHFMNKHEEKEVWFVKVALACMDSEQKRTLNLNRKWKNRVLGIKDGRRPPF